MATATRKGVTQPQNGYIDGILYATSTEATTYSINVSTISGYANVTSILYANASWNLGAASTTIPVPFCQWTTTDCVIKVTLSGGASTTAGPIGIVFKGQ